MTDNTTINDIKGRVLTLRKLGVVDQVKLLRAIGPDQSDNQPYYRMVLCAAAVSAIDGHPVPMPTNERQIDAAVERVGDAGFAAIMAHMKREADELASAAEAALGSDREPVAGPLDIPSTGQPAL